MSEQLDAAMSSLSEQNKKIEIAMDFERDCSPGQEIILKASTSSSFEEPLNYLAFLVDEAALAVAPYDPDPFGYLYLKHWRNNKESFTINTPGITDEEFEYRVSTEGKEENRKEIVDAVNEMAKKHMDLQKGVRKYL